MCGIAGFAGAGTREDLKRMNAAQASRGTRNARHDVLWLHRVAGAV